MLVKLFIISRSDLCIRCLQASRVPANVNVNAMIDTRAFLVVFGRNNINNCGIKSYKTLFPVIFGYNAVLAQTQAWLRSMNGSIIRKDTVMRILGILVQTAPEYFWIWLKKAKRPGFDKLWTILGGNKDVNIGNYRLICWMTWSVAWLCQSNGPKRGDLQDVEIFARRLILFCNASSMQMKYPSASLLHVNHLTLVHLESLMYNIIFAYLAELSLSAAFTQPLIIHRYFSTLI